MGLPLLNCFSWDGSYRIVINPLYTGGSCFFFFFFECFIYTEGPWGLLDVALYASSIVNFLLFLSSAVRREANP